MVEVQILHRYMTRIVPTILSHFLHPWRSDVTYQVNISALLTYNIALIIKSDNPMWFIHNKNTDQHAGDKHFREHK